MRRFPQILGHRGSVSQTPPVVENTLAAYALALELGADGVELDVRAGVDGSLLLHHDPVHVDGRSVADMAVGDRPALMPTLAEALDVLIGSTVNIEIKNLPFEPSFDPTFAVADSIVNLLAARRYADRVIISCFHPATVDRVKQLDSSLTTGLLSWYATSTAECLAPALTAGHDAIHPDVTFVTDDLVRSAHEAGLAVNVWTVNEPDVVERMIDLGVDAIVTDDIPTARAIVDRRTGEPVS